jgi:hypothetical protein
MWYEPWWQTPDTHDSVMTWTHPGQVSRYEPLIGFYSSGDASTIDRQFAAIRAIGVSYLILDETNTISGGDSGLVDKNVRAMFAEDYLLSQSEQLSLSLAIGGQLWARKSTAGQNAEADYVYKSYASTSVYFSWHGKPLLISYNFYHACGGTAFAPNWDDPRFSVRRADCVVYPQFTENSWWGWIVDYPQALNKEAMVVTTGANVANEQGVHDGVSSANIDRDNGAYFEKEWLRAITENPQTIIINGWNEFRDETAIEPSRAIDPTAPAWVDAYGSETPDWYVQIAAAYTNLRVGLMAGGYYRDVNCPAFYAVTNGHLVVQSTPPHGHPIIPLPAGLLGQLGAQTCD